MEKGKTKKSGAFIIRDHYPKSGMRAKELMEKEIYTRLMKGLG